MQRCRFMTFVKPQGSTHNHRRTDNGTFLTADCDTVTLARMSQIAHICPTVRQSKRTKADYIVRHIVPQHIWTITKPKLPILQRTVAFVVKQLTM
jgi:hypothetical protein